MATDPKKIDFGHINRTLTKLRAEVLALDRLKQVLISHVLKKEESAQILKIKKSLKDK